MSTTESKTSSYASEIDSTIEKIESHVEKGTPTGVKTVIGTWVKKLSEHEDLSAIGADLEKLQDALEAKDGKKIISLLTSLGEDTTAAAEKAEGKESTKIKALGKALSAAAKALGKMTN
ncbi:MAG: hypothetical protein LH615_03985 [Ferruginibacter sp.]|nr:hypothetical protein [Ferruginibacter sp.]